MSDHLDWEEMLAFTRAELGTERARALLDHLACPCETCLETFLSALGDPELTPEESTAYDVAIDRALAAVQGRDERTKEEHVSAGGALQHVDPSEVWRMPEQIEGPELVDTLLAKGWALRHEDPRRMTQFAWLAVRAAESLPADQYGADFVVDTRCRASIELANALRVSGRIDEAETEFGRALQLAEVGSVDEEIRIRIVEVQASLAADRNRFPLASRALTILYKLQRRRGDDHQAGRALIKKGLYTGYAGQPEAAIRLLERGRQLVDESREPGLAVSATHNQLLFLVDCGRFRDARKLLFLNRGLLMEIGGRLNRLKLRCLEGRIEAGFGQLSRAEVIFREIRTGFEEVNLPYQAALVTLELAAVLLQQRRAQEARELVLEAARVFGALRIEREALGAIVLLRQACELGAVTAGLVEEVAAFLRRIEHDPTARFDPRGF